jgi:hypothetical protein
MASKKSSKRLKKGKKLGATKPMKLGKPYFKNE